MNSKRICILGMCAHNCMYELQLILGTRVGDLKAESAWQ